MLDKELLRDLEEYVEMHLSASQFIVFQESIRLEDILDEVHNSELADFINENQAPSLQEVLFRFIDKTGATDAEIYNKAGIDRRLFSKIRTNPDYHPRKKTIIALALALELHADDADTLLDSAGYSLSNSDTHDLVIRYCLEKEIYDIHEVNLMLDHFSLKPLVGSL
ncbi:hypothetical protein [Peribacillus sp. SCS-155]|uniref:hypothetical protein n=1 Tax=Peribacillus sedimenti TaxID=3115297 RepID=UPI0039058FEF